MYFVITSEGFEVPATFLIETTPEATSSWINRNRSWTCFVFLEVPNLVAIDLPAVLSVWIRIFTFLESWDSRSNDLIRHSKSYGVKFCLSAGECNCSLCPTLRSDQSAEKVQGHARSAPSWSSTTCPIGVHIGVVACGMIFGRSVKTIGLVPAKYLIVKSSFSCDGPHSEKSNHVTVPLQRTGCLA